MSEDGGDGETRISQQREGLGLVLEIEALATQQRGIGRWSELKEERTAIVKQ